MFANVAQEWNQLQLAQPLVIVDYARRIIWAIEIQVLFKLLPDLGRESLDHLLRVQFSFAALAARIADETGPTTYYADGMVPSHLKASQ